MESIPMKSKSPPPELLMLSCALERLVARNNRLTSVYGELNYKKGLSAFMATRAPTIALQRYLERIHRFADLDPLCFIIAYVYIDRTVHAHPDLIVASMNVHRLTLASLLLASKASQQCILCKDWGHKQPRDEQAGAGAAVPAQLPSECQLECVPEVPFPHGNGDGEELCD